MADMQPGVLDEHEAREVQETFGVARAQVERDHFISHLLAAISRHVPSTDLIFIGGTALSRTHLGDLRLSEDVELEARTDRRQVANAIVAAARRDMQRTFGRLTWEPPLAEIRDVASSTVNTIAGVGVRVQILRHDGRPEWPTEVVDLEQRYSDAPPARMSVPTADAFAAAKLSAWIDRRAERDLYDLWALSVRGLVTSTAVDLFVRHGPFTTPPEPWVFQDLPDEVAWRHALSHQGRIRTGPKEAAAAVAEAWARAARA